MTEKATERSELAIRSSIVSVIKSAYPSAMDLSSSKMILKSRTKDEKKMKL